MTNSIGGVNASTTSAATQGLQRTHHSGGKGPFDAVSDLLGMSADDIASAVRSGTSLDDLAKQKGVSHGDLISALKAGAPAELQGTDQLDQMVEDIATHKDGRGERPSGPPPGPPPGGSGVLSGDLSTSQQQMLDKLADLLGTTSDDLKSSLQSGTSLTQMLQDKGVSLDQLASSLQSGFLVDLKA